MFKNLFDIFRGEGLRSRLIRGGVGSACIQATNRVLALALGIVLARTLGAEGYGVYAYAFALMSLLMVVAEAGVPTLLMREVAASLGREDWGLLRGALIRGGQFVGFAASAVSSIGLAILWTIGDQIAPTTLYTTALMLLVLPLSAGTKTVVHALWGLHRVVLSQFLGVLLRPALVLILVGGAFLLCPEMRQPQYAMAGQLLGAGLVLVTGLLILRRLVPVQAIVVSPAYKNREWLRSALPFTLIGGAVIINHQADIIMLGWFVGSNDVGIYRVAVQGAMLVEFSLHITSAMVAPQFSRFYAQGDMSRLQQIVTLSARAILAGALPIALIFFFLGASLVSLVFGAEFATAYTPLVILAMGQLVKSAFGAVSFLLTMTGYESSAARILWQTAFLNIALNGVLIPFYGINGAALATAISLVVWNALLYIRARHRLGISSAVF